MTPPPPRPLGNSGFKLHPPANLFEQAIALLHVMPTTSRHHIGPFVTAASASRHHVVNRVGVTEAVGALVTITQE